jgi:hypothetical protein
LPFSSRLKAAEYQKIRQFANDFRQLCWKGFGSGEVGGKRLNCKSKKADFTFAQRVNNGINFILTMVLYKE